MEEVLEPLSRLPMNWRRTVFQLTMRETDLRISSLRFAGIFPQPLA